MKRVNYTISDLHIKMLKAMAKKKKISMSEVLRRAIEECWEKFQEKKGR